MQWLGFWTANSYGATYASLPYLPQPLLTWLQNAQNFWFNNMANGSRSCGDCGGEVAPVGCLCDNADPTSCNYKQGDVSVRFD